MILSGRRDDCEMCQEVEAAGTGATGRLSGLAPHRRFSRLVCRTPIVDVLSGLGCLDVGYLLLVPRRHVSSAGELAAYELEHTYALAAEMSDRVRRAIGKPVVAVEHGSSGDARHSQLRPACIAHAHIHLFPLPTGADPAAFVVAGSSRVSDLGALASAATRGRNYYFCSWSPAAGQLSLDASVASQHARRVWAGLLGKPDEWDWAVFPCVENCRETTTRLRMNPRVTDLADTAAADHRNAETVAAYSAGAAWYAERTRAFEEGSALPDEIAELAKLTSGWVLDAGAGACRDAACFAGLGRDVIALDASQRLLGTGVRPDRVHKVAADLRNLPLPAGSVGAVWCSAVLLHFDQAGLRAVLGEFHRVLVPGGFAQISTKQGWGRESVTFTGSPHHQRHFFYHESRRMWAAATGAGFDIVRSWTVREPDVSQTTQTWEKMLLRKLA